MTNRIDFGGINTRLLAEARSLLPAWLPGGKQIGGEYVCANLSGGAGASLSVNTHTGKWADFASDIKGGDLISLFAAINRVGQYEAARMLDGQQTPAKTAPSPKPAKDKDSVAVTPVPQTAPAPFAGDPSRVTAWSETKGTNSIVKASALWPYHDAEGRLLGYVVRMDTPSGKAFVVLTWRRFGDGAERWAMKAFDDPRPLYGLHDLATRPSAPVLIVEGEKACDAARRMVGEKYVCVTWPGGAKAIDKTDWNPLAGREAVIWPDADDAGTSAGRRIGEILLQKKASVRTLDVEGMPKKWDAADALNEGWDSRKVAGWARNRVKMGLWPSGGEWPEPRPETGHPKEIVSVGDANGKEKAGDAGSRSHQTPPPLPKRQGHIYDLPDTNDKGKPLETIENLQEILRRIGVTARYNVMTKDEEFIVPGSSFSRDNAKNAARAWIRSECARFRMPATNLRGGLTFLADLNQYNPMREWVESKPWDGEDRLNLLCSCIVARGEADDKDKQDFKDVLLTKWMLSAIGAAFEPDGVKAGGILVLQSDQYVGKTAFFNSLCPPHLRQEGFRLNLDSNDSVRFACSRWLTELGELDSTFSKSDIGALKAFLTNSEERMRRAYKEDDNEYVRRTVFFGSVNELAYLQDDTGNRRYWTIECESITHRHGIDMQQCWAQVHEKYKRGESWYLTEAENKMLTRSNKRYESADPVAELVYSRLNWMAAETIWEWRTATDVLKSLGYDKPLKRDVNKCASAIRELNGGRSKHDGRARLLFVPPRKSEVF